MSLQLIGTFDTQWSAFEDIITAYQDAAWIRLGIVLGSQAFFMHLQNAWSRAFSEQAMLKYVKSIDAKRPVSTHVSKYIHQNSYIRASKCIYTPFKA